MINNLKTLLIVGLIIIAIVLNLRLGYKQKEVDKLSVDNGVLADNLKRQVVIEKDKVVYKTRVFDSRANGSRDNVSRDNVPRISDTEKVKTEIKYLPPEGKAEINTDLNNNTTLIIRDKGLCFEPCVSAVMTLEGTKAGAGIRLAYWGRYGISCGCSLYNISSDTNIRPYIAIDRRISDVVAFMRNTTVGIVYDGKLGIVLSVFF